ncbi:MAG: nucleotide disphospho-sugar-binding domain-containing protein [Planctomycetota bacterium]
MDRESRIVDRRRNQTGNSTNFRFSAVRDSRTTNHASRILFIGEAVSFSHIARPAVLARWAKEAGYAVEFACGPRYAGVARAEGFEPHLLRTIAPEDFYGRLAKGKFFYTRQELDGYVAAELELIAQLQPDIVVGDFRLTMPVSCELAGIPYVSLMNAYWSPAAEKFLTAPEGGVWGLLPRFLRENLFSFVTPIAYRVFAKPLNDLRKFHGLPAFNDFREHYAAGDFTAYLDLPVLFPSLVGRVLESRSLRVSESTTQEFPDSQTLRPSDSQTSSFFLGPVPWWPAHAPETDLGNLGETRPLAYVSMGSSGSSKRLAGILTQVMDVGYDVAVSGISAGEGDALRRAVPALRGRAVLAEFLNPSAVLDRATVVICHGGSGTIYQAIEKGAPVLALPENADQAMAARAVEKAGAGRIVTMTTLGDALRDAVAGRWKNAALRLATAIETHDTRGRWLRFLENAVVQKSASPRVAESESSRVLELEKAGHVSRVTSHGKREMP